MKRPATTTTKNQTISFSTGNLIINDTSISFHNQGQIGEANTISRDNIGHVDTEPMRLLPKADFVYCIWIMLGGIIVSIIGLAAGMSGGSYNYFYIGLIAFLFGAFLFFAIIWLDALLGMNVGRSILLKMFGVNAVRVVIQNKFGGNSLQFLIKKEEESNLPKLVDYKKDMVSPKQESNTSQGFADIEKLAALKEKGLITNEEFELKKKQILGI